MSMRVKSGLGRLRSAIKASLIALAEGRVELDSEIWPRGTETPALPMHIRAVFSPKLRLSTLAGLTVFIFRVEQSLEGDVRHAPVRMDPVVA